MNTRKNTASPLRLLILLTASLSLVLSGCSAGENKQESAQADGQKVAEQGRWPRTITTDDGQLELKEQPKRIVSMSVTLTGSLLALEAPVVATGASKPNIPHLADDQGFFNQWSKQAKEAKIEVMYHNNAPAIEKAVEYNPDLIIVSKNSGDSVFDQVEQIRKIAPVLVVDYSNADWKAVTKKLGEATGLEKKADEVISTYEARLAEVKGKITVPKEEVSPFIVFSDGSGAAALTKEAPQSQILSDLGFTIATIPDEVKGDNSMGKTRGDIVKLSMENIQKGLVAPVWIAVAADDKARDQIANNPAFNTSPAVKNGKVYYTPGETFRMDYFSATMFIDSIEKQFVQ